MRRIFHIDLDAFFVAVERALDPSLEGKPVVVGGLPGSRGVVACASYEARPYGLRAGMPLARAYRLCPHAVFLPGRFHKYQEVSSQFMEILGRYSPFLEPLGLDEAFMDMTGFESLYGSLVALARQIKATVRKELRIVASIGIASSKVAAKVASDYGKPDGLVEVPPGQDAAFLAPLPLRKLPGAGEKTGQVLQRLGIGTIGELAQVPTVTLRRLFGAYGDMLHLWATGQDSSPVSPIPAPKSISRETTFPQDTRDLNFLLATIRYLGERVGAELRSEGKKARCVTVKVRYADFHTITRHHTLREPACHDEAIFQAGAALLGKALEERREKVRLVGIGVADLVEGTQQLSLWEGQAQRLERLCQAVDKVREKYGFTALETGRTLALGQLFPQDRRGYILKTSCLSR